VSSSTPASRTGVRPRSESISRSIPLVVFAIYLVLPTRNYYWDGVSFAQNIEQAGRFGSPSFWPNLIHPNHLLYNTLGYFVWKALATIGLHVRAIAVLQVISMISAAVCVGMVQRTLFRLTNSAYLSISLAFLFALSAVFWRFATDADAYILSTLFLVAAFHVLCVSPKKRPLLVGLLHAAAMLIHQLAIFFFPAAAFGAYLKGGRRSLVQYCAVATGITLPAYCAGFWLQQRSSNPTAFLHWLTFHSPDSAFSFNPFKNLAITLINYPRLFFGGTGHVLEYFGPFMLVTLILLAIVLAMLLIRTLSHPDELRLPSPNIEPQLPLSVSVSITWLATHAAFLFFWLPSNTFYKLFCLPAIVVIIAHILMRYTGPCRYRLALLVATMALANLAFYIFPYSRPDYNQAMRFAHRMARVWSNHTVVYYGDFVVDDWYIRYFNPQTIWKQINPANGVKDFAEEAEQDLNSGHEVWLDSTAAATLSRSWPEAAVHFDAAQEDNFPKHPIRFYRWKTQEPTAGNADGVR
jgi:hypothetical protein